MSTLNLENIKHPDSASNNISVDSSGRVGIGTGSPSEPLDVVSDSGATAVKIRGRASDNISSMPFASNDGLTTYGTIQGRSTDFRFYANTNNTMTFHTSDTERMRIDSAGRVTMPYQPCFTGTGLSQNNNSGLADINTEQGWRTLITNNGNHFNNTTRLFTCPVDGFYYFSASLLINAPAAGTLCRYELRKNNSYVVIAYDNYNGGNYSDMVVAHAVIPASANDTLSLVITHGDFHSGNESHFSIFLIG